VELSVAIDALVPRYALWLALSDLGHDPEELSRSAVLAFFDEDLDSFLAHEGHALNERARRRLRRDLDRYDPARPTPHEFMERISLARPAGTRTPCSRP